MSCPDEVRLLLYADGDLEDDLRRDTDSHLVQCRGCRTQVIALREESQLLAATLRETAADAAEPVTDEPAAAGLAVGLPVAVAAVTAAFAAIGYAIETRLPGGFDVLRPRRLKGAYDMAFDLVFLLRDRAPDLFEVALSLAVLASVAAVASLAAGALVRRVGGPVMLALGLAAVAVLGAPSVRALDLRLDQDTTIAASETIPETLVATGDALRIDGTIQGDLVLFGERISIGGTVEGNVYAAGREIDLDGVILGTVHVAAREVRVEGEIRGALVGGGERLELDADGSVARDAAFFGEGAVIEGRLARDFVFGGDWLEIAGSVGRDVEAVYVEGGKILESAHIAGDVRARMPEGASLDIAESARIDGDVDYDPVADMDHNLWSAYTHVEFYLFLIGRYVAFLMLGLVLHALVPRLLEGEMRTTPAFFRALGLGFVFFVVGPLALALLAFTLIGIPTAVVGLFGFVFVAMVGHLLVGAIIGRALAPPAAPGWGAFVRSFALGLGVLYAAFAVPFIGIAAIAVTALVGAGLLAQRALAWRA